MQRDRHALRAIVVAIGATACQQALPNPTGPSIVTGVSPGGITGLGTATVNVTTNAAKSIIEWQGFSIVFGETTRFNQPSAASAVLNRVTSTNASSIMGTLQSNGQVFLINSNGISFGPASVVDVAGLVASSLGLTNDDFLSGRMRFVGTAGAGQVTTSDLSRFAPPGFSGPGTEIDAHGGPVYLIAPLVKHGGLISDPEGQVVLAAGSNVEVANPGTPDVTVQISTGQSNLLTAAHITAAGSINMFAGMIDIPQDSLIVAKSNGGTITLKAVSDITVSRTQQLFFPFGDISASGNISLSAGRDIDLALGSGLGTTADVALKAGRNISIGGAIKGPALDARDISLSTTSGAITESASPGGTQLRASRNLALAAGGDALLDGSNSVASVGGSVAGNLVLSNTSPTLVVTDLSVDPGHSLSLTQHGNLTINGTVISGAQAMTATGNVLVTPGGTSGITVHASGPQSIQSDGDMTIQGGTTRDASALVSSSDSINLNVGGTLRLNSGSVPQAWARVQTENRDSTITLNFVGSPSWFVNGVPGAIRQGQSGFLSGNGAAVLGKMLVLE